MVVAFFIYKRPTLVHADTPTVLATSYPIPLVKLCLFWKGCLLILYLEMAEKATSLTGKTRVDLIDILIDLLKYVMNIRDA